MLLFSRLVFSFILIALLTNCAAPQATVQYNRQFDFTKVKSYRIFQRDAQYYEHENISGALRNIVEHAIEQGFEQQGLSYDDSEQADIFVTYHLIGSDYQLAPGRAKQFQDCITCQKQNRQNNANRRGRDFTEDDDSASSIMLNILSPQNERLVWQSSYPLTIESEDTNQEKQIKVRTALAEIFKLLKFTE